MEASNVENEISLPNYLKQLRRVHGYSQQYVADYLHVIRQTYSHYETGRVIPPIATIFALSKLYDTDPSDMISIVMRSLEIDDKKAETSFASIDSESYRESLLSVIGKLTPDQRRNLFLLLSSFIDE